MENLFMKQQELIEEINIELESLDITITSIVELRSIIGENEPDKFQKAAINQFVSEFYNGIENILKRICKYNNITVPFGGDSHLKLFKMFTLTSEFNLPLIFNSELEDEFTNLRKFRHFVIHGYSYKIEWQYLKESIGIIDIVYNQVKQIINDYLESL